LNKERNAMHVNKQGKGGSWLLGFGICLVVGLLVIGNYSFAAAKEYDGIWFMGFNLNHDILKNREVRLAINSALNKDYIARNIASAEVIPISIIPVGMLGYDPDLEERPFDYKYSKLLMKKAGYPINDQRIKKLSLLHTDWLKTIAIAEEIQSNLRNIGIKVDLVEVSYQNETKWIEELTSGKHDFFLMGYKAGIEQLLATSEADSIQIDSYDLVKPVFKTQGGVNFTGYSNAEVDKLLDQLSGINLALKEDRNKKLKQINDILYEDLPVVVFFYIDKL